MSTDSLGGTLANPPRCLHGYGTVRIVRIGPQSLNRYAYVVNNPETFTDSSGACGADNPCPPSPSTGSEPTDPWVTCTIDGTPADCGFAYAMEGAGGIVQCDFCDIPFMGPDGDGWVQIGVGALGDMFYSYNYAGNDYFVSELEGFPSLSWYSDYSWAAGLVPSSGGGGGAPVDKHGVPCRTKILGRFNSHFGTNVPTSDVIRESVLGLGNVTDNIFLQVPVSYLTQFSVSAGRFGGGVFGTGSTLHVVSFTYGGQVNGVAVDVIQAHLDEGNPWIPFTGWIAHLGYVLFHGAGPCP